jgi:hypothetical protein
MMVYSSIFSDRERQAIVKARKIYRGPPERLAEIQYPYSPTHAPALARDAGSPRCPQASASA